MSSESANPAVSAPWERERLEIARLRQELRHRVWRTALAAAAVATAAALAGGLLVDRWQTRAEHRWERMVAIGAEFDELYAATRALRWEPASNGGEGGDALLGVRVAGLREQAGDRARRAVALRERWLRAELQLSPDFRALFGDELSDEWPRVSRAALDALDALGPGERVSAAFDSLGMGFRARMYDRLGRF